MPTLCSFQLRITIFLPSVLADVASVASDLHVKIYTGVLKAVCLEVFVKNSNGSFLKLWYPTTIGFPTKNDRFGVFWGYHHLRKHPNSSWDPITLSEDD